LEKREGHPVPGVCWTGSWRLYRRSRRHSVGGHRIPDSNWEALRGSRPKPTLRPRKRGLQQPSLLSQGHRTALTRQKPTADRSGTAAPRGTDCNGIRNTAKNRTVVADAERFRALLATRESDLKAANAQLASRQADLTRAQAHLGSSSRNWKPRKDNSLYWAPKRSSYKRLWRKERRR